jgi:branched-chain amino acid aminotransferase
MEEIVYLNGLLMPLSQAKVSILDYGFLFGYGLYETIRAYNCKVFRLNDHLARMRYSAERLGITFQVQALRQAVLETVKANGYNDTRIRLTVSIGEGTMTPDLRSCKEPTVLVLAGLYHPYSAGKYQQGFRVIVSSIRRNSQSPITYMKSANTMEHMLARQEAKDAGVDEALFLNEKGYVTESAGCNVFLVSKGVLKTPRFEAGILPGVTRVVTFELAAALGIKFREVNVRLSDLLAADEAFLTNSMIEVMPLTGAAGKQIGDGGPGEITRKLMDAYKALVKKETSEN